MKHHLVFRDTFQFDQQRLHIAMPHTSIDSRLFKAEIVFVILLPYIEYQQLKMRYMKHRDVQTVFMTGVFSHTPHN